jgi:hypothetical protein
MSDQLTAISTLPAGYPTLVGVVYAIAMTSRNVWANIAWARMMQASRFPRPRLREPQNTSSSNDRGSNKIVDSVLNNLRELEEALTRNITRCARHKRFDKSDRLAEREAATLHLIHSYRLAVMCNSPCEESNHFRTLLTQAAAIESLPLAKGAPEQALPSPETDRAAANQNTVAIEVRLLDPEFQADIKVVELGLRDLRDVLVSCGLPAVNRNHDLVPQQVLQYACRPASSRTVHVQQSASLDARFTEATFKIIEILLACGVILGSTGGAWLGLTLCSMFPVRISAGIFSSSFGQRLPDAPIYVLQRDTPPVQIDTANYRFRAAGTVWGRALNQEDYTIEPAALSDGLRVATGYSLQLALLLVFQHFKPTIRQALEFGSYRMTRDAVRYIVLVVIPTVFVIDGRGLLLKRAASRTGPNNRSNIFCAVIYVWMLCGCWTCVLLGQKSFLKPIWKFYLVSEIVQPLAAIGSLALMGIDYDTDTDTMVTREKWFLLWAIGACTIVW